MHYSVPLKYVKNNRAKHYRLTVKAEEIRVTIPRFGNQTQAELFVSQKQNWIHKSWQKIEPLKPISETNIEALRTKAKDYIPKAVQRFAQEAGFNYNQVRIKNIKTRWGSCSGKKNLNFSLHLMRLEKRFIDYVIWHELCHTVHMNHHQKFWDLLNEVCPNARKIHAEMKAFKVA